MYHVYIVALDCSTAKKNCSDLHFLEIATKPMSFMIRSRIYDRLVICDEV